MVVLVGQLQLLYSSHLIDRLDNFGADSTGVVRRSPGAPHWECVRVGKLKSALIVSSVLEYTSELVSSDEMHRAC
jgi:hypothetical protein